MKDSTFFFYIFGQCAVLAILAVPLTLFAASFAIFHKDSKPAEAKNPPQDANDLQE
jgi:mannose/fructose/N-acetylgalactosamine-specific phosphotransferase system component IIC